MLFFVKYSRIARNVHVAARVMGGRSPVRRKKKKLNTHTYAIFAHSSRVGFEYCTPVYANITTSKMSRNTILRDLFVIYPRIVRNYHVAGRVVAGSMLEHACKKNA